MKKILSAALCAAMLAGTLASCANVESDRLDPAITLTSSDARANAEWLDNRLDEIPDDVIIGIGSDDEYGIDMSDFESDGYILREMGGEVLIFGASADGLDRAVRKYAKAAEAGATAELDEAYHEGYRIEKLTVAGRDISEYTVVYEKDGEVSIPRESGITRGNAEYAAGELVRLIEEACGAHLETATSDTDGPMIKIGYLADAEPGYNGFEYEVRNGNLYINGGPEANGCANAIYYLLETECGWNSLLYGNSSLVESEHTDIPEGTAADVDPMFDYWSFWIGYFDNERDSRSQGYYGKIPVCRHGIMQWSGSANPWQQMCYTNEDQYDEVYLRIYDYLETRVAAGAVLGKDLSFIDIAQVDSFGYCTCAGCLKVFREEGGVYSGAVVRFANKLSGELSEDLPGVKYGIFAYHGSNIPCKTAVGDDVYVTFCTDGACANHKLDGSECTGTSFDFAGYLDRDSFNNSDYGAWLREWCRLSKNVYVWHYAFGEMLHSMAYFENIYADMMFIRDCGAKGLFLNADVTAFCLGNLRFRLMSEIIWHPDMTEEEYNERRDRILKEEYGEGWSWVLDFIEIWEGTEIGCWNCWGFSSLISTGEIDIEEYSRRADEMYSLLERAYALCESKEEAKAVGKHMTEVLYRQCYTSYFKAYDAGDEEKLAYLDGRYQRAYDILIEVGLDPKALLGFGGNTFAISDNLEDSAWIDWIDWRDSLTAEGAVQRPAPEKYTK